MTATATAVTPYRSTHMRSDLAEYTLREPAFDLWRSAAQIAQGHAGERESQHWRFVSTGAITIEPWHQDLSNLHQLTDSPGAIIRKSDFDTVDGIVERPTWRAPTDLLDVTVLSAVAATGDHFWQKTVGAGKSWAQSKTADIESYGQVPNDAYNVTVDRIAISKSTFPGNAGFVVRMVIPANAPHHKQVLGSLYFGGPVSGSVDGTIPTGQYCTVFTGTGNAELWMAYATGGSLPKFKKIDTWQAFDRAARSQQIICEIWPHFTANHIPTILFKTADTTGTPTSVTNSYFWNKEHSRDHAWYGWANNDLPVTGDGAIRIDTPRDVRPPIQVSRIKFPWQGFVWDDPFSVDFFPSIVNYVTLLWHANTDNGSSVAGGLYDQATGDILTQKDAGSNYVVYKLNPGQYYYNAKFTLTPSADGNTSPLLYGYKVIRDALYRSSAPGEFDYLARRISISGPDKDLTHETASATVEDLTGQLTTLNTRGRIRSRIETEYDPTDSSLRSVLFDGFIDRADGKLLGTQAYEGLSQRGIARQFPAAQWKEFALSFSGVWRRLREKLTMQRVYLLGVPGDGDTSGKAQPYKVSDVCRAMLGWCGFAASQIDIPDSPIRFYSQENDANMVEPLAEIGDVVAGFLHDYLGWFLVWDGNAGAGGMIRAIVPPPLPGPYNPLANFTLDLPSAGRLSHKPGTYGSVNWVASQPGGPGSDVTIPTTFVRRRTFQTHVKPPEANAIHVTGTGLLLPNKGGQYQLNQWCWNPKSYDFFVDDAGNPILTADPTDPDYLGEFIPLVVVNTSLGGGIQNPITGQADGQHSVDILTRRLYDAACRAQKWAMFEAPLVLVIDKNDGFQANPRPLRYYDAVTITSGGLASTWLVRSCNPDYKKDSLQMAHYELLFVQ